MGTWQLPSSDHVAVIRGKDDEGLLQTAALLQGGEDAAHLVVDLQDEGGVVGAHFALLRLGVGAA
jgi:hypothetical protein